ncbi:MAG: SufS family cysteine desulfurase [Candidatus Pacebacteria bacterium]|nr:SufS family cysteine desulfurase [Candidatus Paceibacterota bacterium]
MNQYKADFPIFKNYPKLVYLDNAATSQKPQVVLDAIESYYTTACANVHRGVHKLSDTSTEAFELSRREISSFFGANKEELILTRNATEALNGIAYGWAEKNMKAGDIILTSIMEHHANIVPWQELSKKFGTKLQFINISKEGSLDLTDLQEKINKYGNKIKLISIAHVSNALGTVNPLDKIRKIINDNNLKCRFAIDGAQSAPHMKIDFHKLDIDFYAFSGHKMLGPMGIGGLIVRESLLKSKEMSPWLFGGGMIESVYKDKTTFNEDLSERFIAGTPDVASATGLAIACDYLGKIGMVEVEKHDRSLISYALDELKKIEEIEIVGPLNAKHRLGSITFIYKGVHAHDVAQILDSENVAVRSGHHCTMPLHLENKWIATVRASFSVYNDKTDIDKLIKAIKKIKKIFK